MNVLRGLVSLGILIRHFSTAHGFAQQWPWWTQFGVQWVPATECFLVVSGYFLAHTFRSGKDQFLSLREFARRRGYRLMVPYWVALGLAYVGLLVTRFWGRSLVADEVLAPLSILANAFGVSDLAGVPSPIQFFWTVVTLVQMYATWAAAFWCVRQVFLLRGVADYHHRATRVMVALTGGVLVVSGVLTWAGWLPADGWGLPRWAAYPAAGAFAYWTTRRQVSVWLFPILLAFMGAGADLADSPRPLFGGVTAVLLVAAGGGLFTPTGAVWRLASGLGNWSYSTYLMHSLVYVRLLALISRFDLTPQSPVQAAFLLLAAMAASVAAGWLLYVLVERPMTVRAAAVTYRR